ncbi:MAG: hypothetical protein ACLFPR_07965 [Desulfococcaceae bacterium]
MGQPGRDHWHTLSFTERYSDPAVFMQIMSYDGENPVHVRLRNVQPGSCEYRGRMELPGRPAFRGKHRPPGGGELSPHR